MCVYIYTLTYTLYTHTDITERSIDFKWKKQGQCLYYDTFVKETGFLFACICKKKSWTNIKWTKRSHLCGG